MTDDRASYSSISAWCPEGVGGHWFSGLVGVGWSVNALLDCGELEMEDHLESWRTWGPDEKFTCKRLMLMCPASSSTSTSRERFSIGAGVNG